ncbi:MAG: VTT domain-containing protein [Aromatoleum sp.]|jgi:membrane protein DedA with SNARE-associated domain/rhodanese-related sulfurtransferase|uniref:VTT domain-containing protein n=1 Tax=Aromatoleum sp. TaxID=2307007 RepID=UPI002894CF56|nr:VTT domain-containing protein [Aromatoleum sp.]MDT3670557.1 VTT domain-containing protein [Aromatoleum sp.]
MDLSQIAESIQRDAVSVVFVNVLLQQVGLPVPAVPTLLVAGSLAAGFGQVGAMLAAAVLASVVADWLWYLSGRQFGYRVLSSLCRLSINPASCVTQTEARFMRWGLWSLVVAKFVPGFSTVAPPIAGSLRMPLPGFLLAAGAGAALWAGGAILAGWWLRDELQEALAVMSRQGTTVIVVVAGAVAGWLAWKLWQRYRFEKLAAIPHVTPLELMEALASETPPLLLDLRSAAMVAETGPIAGARAADVEKLLDAVGDWPHERPVVTMCACPADATAVRAARVLNELGFVAVRPLKGGYDAWIAANRPI